MQRIHFMPGDNELHIAVRNCTSFEDFINRIDYLSEEEIIQRTLTTNDQGELPVEVENNRLLNADSDQIYLHLLDFSLLHEVKDLYEPISFQEILNTYNPAEGSLLYYNLKQACKIVNESRKHLKTRLSLSHPSMNGVEKKQIRKLNTRFKLLRLNMRLRQEEIIIQQAMFGNVKDSTYSVSLNFSPKIRKKINSCEKMILDFKVNNCAEMALFAYLFGEKRKLPIAVYHYGDNGDHVFNAIIDNDPQHKHLDYLLRANTVIFDIWGGIICLGKDYHLKMGDHKSFVANGKCFNLITKFNPNFNDIERCQEYKISAFNEKDREIIQLEYKCNLLWRILDPHINNLSAREKYLFFIIIQNNLIKCLDNELISEDEIMLWNNPLEKLKQYFSTDYDYFPLITLLYAKDEDFYMEKICKAIKLGVDPNQASLNGWTALHEATARGYTEIVKILLRAGAEADSYCLHKCTPLMVAAAANQVEIASILLKAGANPNESLANRNETVLFIALIKASEKFVDLLLKHPNIEFSACLKSTEWLHDYAFRCSDMVYSRMRAHILIRLEKGDDTDAIQIFPHEFAAIIGKSELGVKIYNVRCLKQKALTDLNMFKQDKKIKDDDQCYSPEMCVIF